MATQKVVIGGSNISARQMKDFWRQVAEGCITGEAFQAFLDRRNPFERKAVSDIVFAVTSDGRTGEDFIFGLEQGGYRVDSRAVDMMRKPAFVTTNGKTYRLSLIKGEEFSNSRRTTRNIRAEAARRGWLTPPIEVAPLLCEIVSDEKIEQSGLKGLVVMHDPIPASGGGDLFCLYQSRGGRCLDISYDAPRVRWSRDGGFVFLLPQD